MAEYDVVIRGGMLVDGTRMPRRRTDLGLRDGRIAHIGRLPKGSGMSELDADGCIVAPGFVDLHTHYDAQIHWDPYCTISGWHGVTSVALGNCGFGFAPVRPEDRDRALLMMTRTEQIPFESMKAGMDWRWESLPEWLDDLDEIPKGVNALTYVPVNPLMIYVMGLEAAKSRPASEAERVEMQRLLDEAMDAGACGFSIQRLGERSLQTDFDGTPMPTDTMADADILALAEVLHRRDEGFIQITQAEAGSPHQATAEELQKDLDFLEKLAGISGRPILYNAIGVIDEFPDLHLEALRWLRDCNARGLRIFGQGATARHWYQFTFEHWNLYDSSPAWNEATQGSHEEKLRKLSDPTIRARMRAENESLVTVGAGGPISGVTVSATPGFPELERYIGCTIGEIAKAEGKHEVDAILDIAIASELRAEFKTGTTMGSYTNPRAVAELMSDPHMLAGLSDGGAHTKFLAGGSYTTDFLAWLVRDTEQMSLEEAHFHLSYLPAQAAGFVDRGFLREGAPADVVVYELEKLARVPEWDFEIAHDFPANEWRRIQRSEGYRYTLVNGVVTFEDGRCTGATPGRLLRNGRIGHAA